MATLVPNDTENSPAREPSDPTPRGCGPHPRDRNDIPGPLELSAPSEPARPDLEQTEAVRSGSLGVARVRQDGSRSVAAGPMTGTGRGMSAAGLALPERHDRSAPLVPRRGPRSPARSHWSPHPRRPSGPIDISDNTPVDGADAAAGVHDGAGRQRQRRRLSPRLRSRARPSRAGVRHRLRASVTAGCGRATRTTARRRWRAGRRPTSPRTRPRSARSLPVCSTRTSASAPLFEGFIAEIVANGYKVTSYDVGGYTFRCTGGSNPNGWRCDGDVDDLSNHAWGLAVDMNSATNPADAGYVRVGGATACATPMRTDIPRWVVQTAEKWGLYWGGYGWSSGCMSPTTQRTPSSVTHPTSSSGARPPRPARSPCTTARPTPASRCGIPTLYCVDTVDAAGKTRRAVQP